MDEDWKDFLNRLFVIMMVQDTGDNPTGCRNVPQPTLAVGKNKTPPDLTADIEKTLEEK